MNTTMIEKIQELPEEVVNHIYKYLRHPIADIFNEFIDKYNIEYVKDMDIMKHHNLNDDENERYIAYSGEEYHYNMFPIMYFSIRRGEWDIANGYIGDCDRLDISNIYLNSIEDRDLRFTYLFSLIHTDWDSNICKITFRWERSRTNIYEKCGSKYIIDNNDGSVTVSAGFFSDDDDDDDE
jgi:hypothetical protein